MSKSFVAKKKIIPTKVDAAASKKYKSTFVPDRKPTKDGSDDEEEGLTVEEALSRGNVPVEVREALQKRMSKRDADSDEWKKKTEEGNKKAWKLIEIHGSVDLCVPWEEREVVLQAGCYWDVKGNYWRAPKLQEWEDIIKRYEGVICSVAMDEREDAKAEGIKFRGDIKCWWGHKEQHEHWAAQFLPNAPFTAKATLQSKKATFCGCYKMWCISKKRLLRNPSFNSWLAGEDGGDKDNE